MYVVYERRPFGENRRWYLSPENAHYEITRRYRNAVREVGPVAAGYYDQHVLMCETLLGYLLSHLYVVAWVALILFVAACFALT